MAKPTARPQTIPTMEERPSFPIRAAQRTAITAAMRPRVTPPTLAESSPISRRAPMIQRAVESRRSAGGPFRRMAEAPRSKKEAEAAPITTWVTHITTS